MFYEAKVGDSAPVGKVVAPASEVGADQEQLDELRLFIQSMVTGGTLPMLGVTVAKRGRIVFSASASSISQTGQAVLHPEDTILRIYSMTKPITSVAALMLTEEGKLSLDGKVSSYLPAWDDSKVEVISSHDEGEVSTVKAARPITIRDLLCHTSGLSYGFLCSSPEVARLYKKKNIELPHKIDKVDLEPEFGPCTSLKEFASRLNTVPLVLQPGAKFEYSMSTDLLGAVIEAVTGATLGEFFKERIFEPLGMANTAFDVAGEDVHRLAPCFYFTEEGKYELAERGDEDTRYLRGKPQGLAQSGGGGLLSTGNDYIKFAECLTRGGLSENGFRLLRQETVDMMTRDHLSVIGAEPAGLMLAYQGFGLAGGVVTDAKDARDRLPARAAGAGTFAWGGAAGTYFFCDPVNQLTVVMLTQALQYSLGCPTLRPELCRKCYCLFPELRAAQEAAEERGGGDNKALSGFTG